MLQWSVVEGRTREGYLCTEHISWPRPGSSTRLVAVAVFAAAAGAGAVVVADGAGAADTHFDTPLRRHKSSPEAVMWEPACHRTCSPGWRCEGNTLD